MSPAEDRPGVDRRTMLKAALAAGTVAGTWVTPRIESFGFTPAGAFTPCIILSPEADDKNSQSGQSDCPEPDPTPGLPVENCCGQAFGSANNQIKRFTFETPVTGCDEIVVRTISRNCADNRNPDVGQFALIIESTSGEAACGQCEILEAVLVDSSQRTPLETFNNGDVNCPAFGNPGTGIDASMPCDNENLASDARLAVRLICTIQTGECDPP